MLTVLSLNSICERKSLLASYFYDSDSDSLLELEIKIFNVMTFINIIKATMRDVSRSKKNCCGEEITQVSWAQTSFLLVK